MPTREVLRFFPMSFNTFEAWVAFPRRLIVSACRSSPFLRLLFRRSRSHSRLCSSSPRVTAPRPVVVQRLSFHFLPSLFFPCDAPPELRSVDALPSLPSFCSVISACWGGPSFFSPVFYLFSKNYVILGPFLSVRPPAPLIAVVVSLLTFRNWFAVLSPV